MAQSRAGCRTTVDARFLVFFVVVAARVGACGGEIGHRAPVGVAGTGAASGTAGASGTGADSGGGTVIPPAGTDPGRVTLHRLNRVEYDNTVRDLLGTTATPAKEFPADDRGYGLDNLADILTLSPVHINLYQSTAESLVTQTLAGTQRAKIAICDPATGEACVRSILKSFARRAWRRPVADAEVDNLMKPVSLARSNGDTWELGLSLGLQATLVSPHFIFRVELDPQPASLAPHPLNDHEIATRLSYFLWSTMPDEALFAAADAGTLTNKVTLQAEVTRMLTSPKAAALIDNFAGQWLHTRQVDEVQPDSATFPMFDATLREAMRLEARLMFGDVLSGALAADKLLTADYTYLNDRLARHYGLPLPGGTQMQKVPLGADVNRGGFLTQGAFLTVTSHPSSTSPVLRGKWILTELLCQNVPPPPGDVNTMLDPSTANLSARERLELHQQSACATCHKVMDPLGFALENYDGVGAYRTMERTFAIDASGNLPDGRSFNGARELSAVIAKDPGLADCMTRKVYTYALGRTPQTTPAHMDPNVIATLARSFRDGGFSLPQLIAGVATSDTFLKRRGEAGGAP